ncbi:pectinesterase family protein [Portibacter lacus]|uniref:Pectinesterase catalytic domain-containing protein n=1 Tax=Portibacter lacus TaxID=1099794 RepID=A0AA37SK78_9BACT|nr:pectinesterase family protein [Portibacter lacus]GLR15467.1 hypothetical protein GCM10007940_00820 [Portibacter lacus]
MRLSTLRRFITLIFILFTFSISGQCDARFNAIVSLDNSGDYTSIQEAINASTGSQAEPYTIFIKDGIYDEKLYFEKSYITLVGESRDSTIITTAVLRRSWRETNDSDWGAATVNIAKDVTDLTFAHLTIRNNFADVYPDFPNPNDHTFAMRGGGHRIITIDCNIISTGGDTLSLWNTDGGMYYHKSCFFTGYVDFIAPRGYCYMEDCTFYGYNSTASIWHDGSGGEDHKLVIQNGTFDGKVGFALGRYHRDAQFYLLNCTFSENMKNQEIYWEGKNEITWSPDRKYYYNNHRPQFDWTWYKDNLHEAPGNPKEDDINALWTFNNEWDPESKVSHLLPAASFPTPEKNACFSREGILAWIPGRCAEQHLISLGKMGEELKIIESTEISNFAISGLEENTTYQWRIDEVFGQDTVKGSVWNFHTEKTADNLPNIAYAPHPENMAAYDENLVRLEWKYDHCTVDSFLVNFGKDPDNLEYKGTQKNNYYIATEKKSDTIYYWRIDSKNEYGIEEGETWSYTYDPTTSQVIQEKHSGFFIRKASPNPFSDTCSIEYVLPNSGDVSISVLSQDGKLIQQQFIENQQAGDHTYRWNNKGIRGFYVFKIGFQNQERITKLISQ